MTTPRLTLTLTLTLIGGDFVCDYTTTNFSGIVVYECELLAIESVEIAEVLRGD